MRLRVATFDIRNGLAWDGRHSWPFRRRAAAATVASLAADCVALQEARGFQIRWLLRHLAGFAACGAGRDDGRGRGERCAVLYDARRLHPECWRTRWFSATPDRPGSLGPGGPPPRTATLVRFRADTGTRFGLAAVHWDGASLPARLESAALLLRWTADGLPWVVLGDFNATPDDPSLRRLLAAGLRDPLAHLGRDGPGAGTHHRWDGRTDGTRIDHVLVTGERTVVEAAVVHGRPGGRLPSDHWPVAATLELG